MRERIVIVFIAVAIGLIVTTLIFFLYQQTRSLPNNVTSNNSGINLTPTPIDEVPLFIEEPTDESLSDRRTITVKGQTNPENLIVISTNQEDIVAKPTSDGKFSVSIDIDTGSNKIVTRSITPKGATAEDVRIITFNTEEF